MAKREKKREIDEILAENMRLRVGYIGLSWESLAIAAGEVPKNVRNWASHGRPNIMNLERLAKVLNVPTWSLLHPEFDPREYEKPPIAKAF